MMGTHNRSICITLPAVGYPRGNAESVFIPLIKSLLNDPADISVRLANINRIHLTGKLTERERSEICGQVEFRYNGQLPLFYNPSSP